MFTDWALASLHHLAIFTLAATIAAELAILTGIIDAKAIVRLTRDRRRLRRRGRRCGDFRRLPRHLGRERL